MLHSQALHKQCKHESGFISSQRSHVYVKSHARYWYLATCKPHEKSVCENFSLVPRTPLFAFTIIHGLPVCIHNNTRLVKKGESLGAFINVRWTRGGRRGGGTQLSKQHTRSSIQALLQFWTPDVSVIETTHLDW